MPQARDRSSSGRWLVAILMLASLVVGCGSPQQRYKTLSFFFDGVPDPSAQNQSRFVTARGQTVFIHRPYADKNCDACHENSQDIFARAKLKPGACLNCHGKVLTEYRRMHGPVAGRQCLACHQAHQSSEKHLLKQPSPALCVQCHERATITAKVPEHLQVKTDCETCHSGHGGENRNLLKLAATPATAPAATGDAVLK